MWPSTGGLFPRRLGPAVTRKVQQVERGRNSQRELVLHRDLGMGSKGSPDTRAQCVACKCLVDEEPAVPRDPITPLPPGEVSVLATPRVPTHITGLCSPWPGTPPVSEGLGPTSKGAAHPRPFLPDPGTQSPGAPAFSCPPYLCPPGPTVSCQHMARLVWQVDIIPGLLRTAGTPFASVLRLSVLR